jgi:hypothetical protein
MTATTRTPTPALLRLEVGRLRRDEPRPRFDTIVHVGRLGGERRTFAVTPTEIGGLDAGTRIEVISRLLEDGPAPDSPAGVWVTRAGEPHVQDDDLAWHSAACMALGSLERSLEGFWVVTRTGWLDVRTGEVRTWKRLRL